jgi:hypothetical protein
MAKGDFARLREWAGDDGYEIVATPPASTNDGVWIVSVELEDPVKMRAIGRNRDIDEAAASVIEQLTTIGETIA